MKTNHQSHQSKDALDRLLIAASETGVLPPNTKRPLDDSRPWPIILLTALGAWLVSVPLIIACVLLVNELRLDSTFYTVIGLILLVASAALLRVRNLPFFVEQLAVPVLLLGYCALGFGLGLGEAVSVRMSLVIMMSITFALAGAIPRPWLRILLGFVAAGFMHGALVSDYFWQDSDIFSLLWLPTHSLLFAWLFFLWLQHRVLHKKGDARFALTASVIEPFANGWVVAALFYLAAFAFSSLMSNSLGYRFGDNSSAEAELWGWFMRSTSLLMAVAGMLVLARVWPNLRNLLMCLLTLVLAALSFWIIGLGSTLLILAMCAAGHRWRLAAAAALTVVWIFGVFYFELDWLLSNKALLLAVCGLALGASVFIDRLITGWKKKQGTSSTSPTSPVDSPVIQSIAPRWAAALVAVSAVVTLALINYSIWQKESLIAHGQVVYVQLAPVDPRSLMQGDYMRLDFGLPSAWGERGEWDESNGDFNSAFPAKSAFVFKRDEHGVATFVRPNRADEPLAADELLIEPVFKNGHWILVTDAWFFKQGDAERWEKARYGEFRVTPDGKALLVGMADENRQAIPIHP